MTAACRAVLRSCLSFSVVVLLGSATGFAQVDEERAPVSVNPQDGLQLRAPNAVPRGEAQERSDQSAERGSKERQDEKPESGGQEASSVERTETQQAARRTTPIPPDERSIQFAFASAPWEQVLNWLAEVSGLALQIEATPPGTFNYVHDPNKYTLPEVIDILNEALIPEGFYIVRKGNFLKVISIEQGVPAELIPRVSPEELDDRGRTEFVTVVLPVEGVDAGEIASEVEQLKSEYGKVVALKSINSLMITDTAESARLIRDYLEKLSSGEHAVQVKFRAFRLKYASARSVEVIVRDILGLPPRQNQSGTSTPSRDPREAFRERMRAFFAQRFGRGESRSFGQFPFGGSRGPEGERRPPTQPQQQTAPAMTTSVDEYTNTLFVAAPPDRLAQVEEMIRMIDVPRDTLGEEVQTPVLRVYRLGDGDAESLVEALRVIYQENPSVRFSADQSNNAVVAIAPESEHATIERLVRDFEEGGRETVVIQLTTLDAVSAEELLNELFGSGQTDFRGRPVVRPGQPRIQADTSRNRLVIRASKAQIEEIRQVLASLGEYHALTSTQGSDRVRVVPLTGVDVQELARRLRQIWPRPNPIKVIMPETRRTAPHPRLGPPQPTGPQGTPQPEGAEPGLQRRGAPDASVRRRPHLRFVSVLGSGEAQPQAEASPQTPTQETTKSGTGAAKPKQPSGTEEPRQQEQPEAQGAPSVIIYPGPNGLVIASDDPQALDEAYRIIQALTQQAAGPQFVVIPLRYADATQVASVLEQLLTETEDRPIFPFFFFGGREQQQETLRIVPEPRTNSIILSGSPNEIERARQLIEQVLDREDLPMDSALPRPRIISVVYGDAEQIAQVIRDVYAGYISGGGQQAPPQPGPGFGFFRGRGPQPQTASRNNRLSIGVDTTSNSIIVSCSEPLFREIEQLVRTLDQAALASQQQETVRIIAVRNATPSQIKEALLGLQGVSTESRKGAEERRRERGRREEEREEGQEGGPRGVRPPFGGFGPPFGGPFRGRFFRGR